MYRKSEVHRVKRKGEDSPLPILELLSQQDGLDFVKGTREVKEHYSRNAPALSRLIKGLIGAGK